MRTTAAEDTMSAMAFTQQVVKSSTLIFLSWQADCHKQVDDESLQGEGWFHEERSMSSIPPSSVSTDNVRVNGVTRRTTFFSLKGGVRETKECFVKGYTARFSVGKCPLTCTETRQHGVACCPVRFPLIRHRTSTTVRCDRRDTSLVSLPRWIR